MSSKPKNFVCNMCPKRFSLSAELESHKNIHFGLRPYKCKICARSYPSRKSLDEHKKIHSQKTYQCDLCTKIFFYNYKLVSHRKKCRQSYVCECGKIYSRKFYFMRHLEKHMQKERMASALETEKFINEQKHEFQNGQSPTCSSIKEVSQTDKISPFNLETSSSKISDQKNSQEIFSQPSQYQAKSQTSNSFFSEKCHFVIKKYIFACHYCKKKFATRKLKDTHVDLTHQDS